jgi:hypothetical protein
VKPCSLHLSDRRLAAGDDVAILGYPRTRTEYAEDADGDMLCRFTFTPDYFEGEILDHHPSGAGLASHWPAYSTNITPPAPLRDFSGISGGPLVSPDTIEVHGPVCSASDSYSICTDIEPVLSWLVFHHDARGTMSLRELLARPGHYTITGTRHPVNP